MAFKLNSPIAIVDKRRPKANAVEVMNIIGDVKDKICIMSDDMIDTAGTIVLGAEALKNAGAKEVYACCTHSVLSGAAIERLQNSCIKEVVVLNTYPLTPEKKIDKIKVLSVGPLISQAIDRIYGDKALSELYN